MRQTASQSNQAGRVGWQRIYVMSSNGWMDAAAKLAMTALNLRVIEIAVDYVQGRKGRYPDASGLAGDSGLGLLTLDRSLINVTTVPILVPGPPVHPVQSVCPLGKQNPATHRWRNGGETRAVNVPTRSAWLCLALPTMDCGLREVD